MGQKSYTIFKVRTPCKNPEYVVPTFIILKYLFFFLTMLCRILFPQPRIETVLPVLEAESRNHLTAREVLIMKYLDFGGDRYFSYA